MRTKTRRALRPIVAALIARCNDDDVLLECLEILLPKYVVARAPARPEDHVPARPEGHVSDDSRNRFGKGRPLTMEVRAGIAARLAAGVIQEQIAKEFGVAISTVARVARTIRESNGTSPEPAKKTYRKPKRKPKRKPPK